MEKGILATGAEPARVGGLSPPITIGSVCLTPMDEEDGKWSETELNDKPTDVLWSIARDLGINPSGVRKRSLIRAILSAQEEA
jgi:hypothetical protein